MQTTVQKATAPSEHKISSLQIKLKTDAMHLSHILEIKQILAGHKGDLPVQMEFYEDSGKVLGVLHLDTQWSIVASEQLKNSLAQLAFVHSSNYL